MGHSLISSNMYTTDKSETVPHNSKHNGTPMRIKTFTGRSEILEKLHSLLSDRSSSSLDTKVNVSALFGLGGTGKSSTAVEYCWCQEQYYSSGIYWLSADFIEESLRFLGAVALEIVTENHGQIVSEDIVYSVMAKLSRLPSPWLVVIDNLDDIEQLSNGPLEKILFGSWMNTCLKQLGTILVTTRCRPDAVVEALQLHSTKAVLLLDVFSEEESVSFVKARLENVREQVDYSSDVAARLSKLLGYLPLALEQATSGIIAMKCTLTDYVRQYKIRRSCLMKRHKARKVSLTTAKERLAVRTTWHFNFNLIIQDTDYGAEAGLFLMLSAFLGADKIPFALINAGLANEASIAEL